MNLHERSDPVLRLLDDLRAITPSADLDRRVVPRCRAVLAHRRQRDEALAAGRARMLDVAMAAAIAVYGLIAAITAVQIVLFR